MVFEGYFESGGYFGEKKFPRNIQIQERKYGDRKGKKGSREVHIVLKYSYARSFATRLACYSRIYSFQASSPPETLDNNENSNQSINSVSFKTYHKVALYGFGKVETPDQCR